MSEIETELDDLKNYLINEYRANGGTKDLKTFSAAMITNESVWFGVIQPALMDHKGKAYFLSTPRGRNWFYDVYMMGRDLPGNIKYDSQYKSWNLTSYSNPYNCENNTINTYKP